MPFAQPSTLFLSSETPHVALLTHSRRIVAEVIEGLAGTEFVVSPISTRGAFVSQLGSGLGPLAVVIDLSLRREDPLEAIAMLGSMHYGGAVVLLTTRDWVRRSEAERLCAEHQISVAGWLTHAEVGNLASILAHQIVADDRVSLWSLRHAIADGHLKAFFQPQVDFQSGVITGAEALVRWCRTDCTVLTPESFLAVADHGGMVPAMTVAVFEQVAKASRALLQTGIRALSVNLSTSCLRNDALVDWLIDRARAGGIKAGTVVLEITEGPDLDTDTIAAAARALHEAGYPLSLDDFGMAFSSLDRLARLPIRELKIDRAMVSRVIDDRRYRKVLEAIQRLADDLGIETCAEGVESDEVRTMLASLGCRRGQGWLFGRPEPFDHFVTRLSAQPATTPVTGG